MNLSKGRFGAKSSNKPIKGLRRVNEGDTLRGCRPYCGNTIFALSENLVRVEHSS